MDKNNVNKASNSSMMNFTNLPPLEKNTWLKIKAQDEEAH